MYGVCLRINFINSLTTGQATVKIQKKKKKKKVYNIVSQLSQQVHMTIDPPRKIVTITKTIISISMFTNNKNKLDFIVKHKTKKSFCQLHHEKAVLQTLGFFLLLSLLQM